MKPPPQPTRQPAGATPGKIRTWWHPLLANLLRLSPPRRSSRPPSASATGTAPAPSTCVQWLAREGLAIDDFEPAVERDLLIGKFQRHLTQPRVAVPFAAHTGRWARRASGSAVGG